MILIEKKWNMPSNTISGDADVPLTHRLLFSRGITECGEVSAFLSGSHDGWHDPMLFPDMEPACERIASALAGGERILVYGDYDADGITSTALLVHFLRRMGADCSYMIPDRFSDGYGMSEALAPKIRALGAALVITVDCGVANIEEVASLMRAGIDVIVTDHHEVKPVLPSALAVLNAKRGDSRYPFTQLSGVGVALKLVQALCGRLSPLAGPDDWRDYLDLAAVGTIADVVPVLDENRTLVREGVVLLREMRRPGIRALCEAAGQNSQAITTTSISYLLVPRINASGRMGDASRAVELLLTENDRYAVQLADTLSKENALRQEIELQIFEEAVGLLENKSDEPLAYTRTGPIVVRGRDWHPGVIGIVASRLVARYNRPAIVFTELSGRQGILKGSARASEGYNILEAILFAQDCTEQFGGHPKAAGISVADAKFDDFAKMLEDYDAGNTDESPEPTVFVDACLKSGDLTIETCREISGLEPFGEGNREPRFLVRGLRIVQSSSCGNGKHLKMKFALPGTDAPGTVCDGIAFGMGAFADLYSVGSDVDAVFTLVISEWKGRESLSMHILDIHFPKSGRLLDDKPDVLDQLYRNRLGIRQLAALAKAPAEQLLPAKDDFKKVYQFLRTRCAAEISLCDLSLLARYVSVSYGMPFHGFALARILDVFEESGLIRVFSRKGQRVCFSLMFVDGKVKLENTPTFQRLFAGGDNVI